LAPDMIESQSRASRAHQANQSQIKGTRWPSSSIFSIHHRIMIQMDPFANNSARHK